MWKLKYDTRFYKSLGLKSVSITDKNIRKKLYDKADEYMLISSISARASERKTQAKTLNQWISEF